MKEWANLRFQGRVQDFVNEVSADLGLIKPPVVEIDFKHRFFEHGSPGLGASSPYENKIILNPETFTLETVIHELLHLLYFQRSEMGISKWEQALKEAKGDFDKAVIISERHVKEEAKKLVPRYWPLWCRKIMET